MSLHSGTVNDPNSAYASALSLGLSAQDPTTWHSALKQLRHAADLGHAQAQRELALLTDWQDQATWPPLPQMQPLCQAPVILTLPSFIPAPLCDYLIERALPLIKPALVYDETTGKGRQDQGRTNQAGYFKSHDGNLVTALIQRRISQASGVPLSAFEPLQVLSYEPGQVFDWHVDYLDPTAPAFQPDLARRGQRIATCLVYLNQDYTGGETGFQFNDIRHRGQTGDALMWSNILPDGRPDLATIHAGLPPSSGRKWVLSQWIRDRPQPPNQIMA